MKRILLSLITLIAVIISVTAATKAYFADTENSNSNTFAAGTLDLNLNGGDTDVAIFSLTDLVPGDQGTGVWTIYNNGSINGFLDLHSLVLTDNDNELTEPEQTDGDNSGGDDEGELSANINVNLFIDVAGDGVYDSDDGDTSIYTGLLSGIAADYDQNITLDAGEEKYISLNWEIPTSVGNVIQSDSVQLDLSFELGQTTGQ